MPASDDLCGWGPTKFNQLILHHICWGSRVRWYRDGVHDGAKKKSVAASLLVLCLFDGHQLTGLKQVPADFHSLPCVSNYFGQSLSWYFYCKGRDGKDWRHNVTCLFQSPRETWRAISSFFLADTAGQRTKCGGKRWPRWPLLLLLFGYAFEHCSKKKSEISFFVLFFKGISKWNVVWSQGEIVKVILAVSRLGFIRRNFFKREKRNSYYTTYYFFLFCCCCTSRQTSYEVGAWTRGKRDRRRCGWCVERENGTLRPH